MPFMRGTMPLRRTLCYLTQAKIVFRDEVKVQGQPSRTSLMYAPKYARGSWRWSHSNYKGPQDKKGYTSDGWFKLAIPPNEFDVVLSDINEEGLEEVGYLGGIVNLSPAQFPSVDFPAEGFVYSVNNRLMISLVCRRVDKPASTINVWFVVDASANATYLSTKTIEALIRPQDSLPTALGVAIQNPESVIECHLSPPLGHFPDANVLGMMALRKLKLQISIDWDKDCFKLFK